MIHEAQNTCLKNVDHYEITLRLSDIQIEIEAHTERESYYYKSIILYDQLSGIIKHLFENSRQIFTTIKQSDDQRLSFQDGSFRLIVKMGNNKDKEIELIVLKKNDYTLIELQSKLKTVADKKNEIIQKQELKIKKMFNDIRTASVCGDKVYLKGNKCYSDNYRV